ncbi:MAG TPA: ankyrin repeat domain-containing protein [Acidobacteriota bacterium]|nr:ankyrin repeat domain-containing protein [Acidobacteriota bacterium]
MRTSVVLALLLLLTQSAFTKTIFEAVKEGDSTSVAQLLRQDADLVRQFDDRHCSPLHHAASGGKMAIVNQLIAGGAAIDAKDSDGETPLHWASYNGRTEVVELLISLGTSVDIVSNDGITPLHYAINRGHEEVVMSLIANGADITIVDSRKRTPLWLATERSNVTLVNMLLSAGADVNVTRPDGTSLLSQAALCNQTAIGNLLIDKGVDLNSRNARGLSPLHFAAVSGSEEFTDLMIQHHADLEVKAMDGSTPLAFAKAAGHDTIVELLFSGGATNIDPPFPSFSGPYLGMQPPGKTPEQFLSGIITFVYRPHGGVTISKNNHEIYWVRNCPNFQKIWYTREVDGIWSRPKIASFNSSVDGVGDEDPYITPDGMKLFFSSNRPLRPGEPARDVQSTWFVDRTEDGWSEPRILEIPGRDKTWDVGGATVSSDGSVFFHVDYVENGTFVADIYSMSLENNAYGAPEKLSDAINSPSVEAKPYVAPDGSYLIFSSHRPLGGIMMSRRRADGTWAEASNISNLLGDEIISLQGISTDGKYLLVNGARDGHFSFYWIDASILQGS